MLVGRDFLFCFDSVMTIHRPPLLWCYYVLSCKIKRCLTQISLLRLYWIHGGFHSGISQIYVCQLTYLLICWRITRKPEMVHHIVSYRIASHRIVAARVSREPALWSGSRTSTRRDLRSTAYIRCLLPSKWVQLWDDLSRHDKKDLSLSKLFSL